MTIPVSKSADDQVQGPPGANRGRHPLSNEPAANRRRNQDAQPGWNGGNADRQCRSYSARRHAGLREHDHNRRLAKDACSIRCSRPSSTTMGSSAASARPASSAPRAILEGGDLVGWGMATSLWDAFQRPITVGIVLSANGHAEVACNLRHPHRRPHHHGAGRGEHAGPTARQHQY
jgi:hypothetical protein